MRFIVTFSENTEKKNALREVSPLESYNSTCAAVRGHVSNSWGIVRITVPDSLCSYSKYLTSHAAVACFQIRPHFSTWFKRFQLRIWKANFTLPFSRTLSADNLQNVSRTAELSAIWHTSTESHASISRRLYDYYFVPPSTARMKRLKMAVLARHRWTKYKLSLKKNSTL